VTILVSSFVEPSGEPTETPTETPTESPTESPSPPLLGGDRALLPGSLSSPSRGSGRRSSGRAGPRRPAR
jgi:serine/threonine-protein kinase